MLSLQDKKTGVLISQTAFSHLFKAAAESYNKQE